MDRSSRFNSLSGLSGILAGISGLAGAGVVAWYLASHNLVYRDLYSAVPVAGVGEFVTVSAMVVLILAISSVVYLSYLKAQKTKQSVSHSQGQRMVSNLFIPLGVGGLFCLVLIYHGILYLVAPAMLIFYGLSLINASKYTFLEIRYLGICETVLGLVACFFIEYGLLAWALGFGILNIVFGALIYSRYEKV